MSGKTSPMSLLGLINMNDGCDTANDKQNRNMYGENIKTVRLDSMKSVQNSCSHTYQAAEQQYPMPCAIFEFETDQKQYGKYKNGLCADTVNITRENICSLGGIRMVPNIEEYQVVE